MNHERLLSNHVSRSVNERIQDKPRSYVVDGDSTGILSKREVVLLSTHSKGERTAAFCNKLITRLPFAALGFSSRL